MSLRWRLLLLIALLTLLPALPAAWVTHDLLGRAADIGLREEIDAALEAGVRQAREGLQAQRVELGEEAARWQRAFAEAGADVGSIDPGFADPAVRVELGGALLAPGDPELAVPDPEIERNAPPLRIRERTDLDGSPLVLTRFVDPVWRQDALRTSTSLQMVRSMRAERGSIERGFLLPFVAIYSLGLLIAIAAALLVARVWTHRVDRLLVATDAVAAGDWEVQVGLTGNDELARLGTRLRPHGQHARRAEPAPGRHGDHGGLARDGPRPRARGEESAHADPAHGRGDARALRRRRRPSTAHSSRSAPAS